MLEGRVFQRNTSRATHDSLDFDHSWRGHHRHLQEYYINREE